MMLYQALEFEKMQAREAGMQFTMQQHGALMQVWTAEHTQKMSWCAVSKPQPYPTPHTMHRTICTLQPTPYTLHPKPSTLNTQNTKHQTLSIKPLI